MSKTARDYPVTFGYGAKDGKYYGPNGSVGAFHRGNDRPTPVGTPVIIDGVTIGKTGATGLVSGPHLHTQAGTDKACQNTFDPAPLEFKAGKVVATRNTDSGSWGKYVTLEVGGRYITYAHLNEVLVSVGQVIGQRKSDEQIADEVMRGIWGNGAERKQRLTAAGYDYNAVQAIVNKKLSGSKPAPAPAKPELETYHLNQDVPGYRSSTDAINRRNSNSTVRKGVYKLSHRVKGADHLIRMDGSGGWWIRV